MKKYLLYIPLILLGFISNNIFASHIRAGEIIAERTSTASYSFHFTLILYTADDGPTISPTATITASDGWESPETDFTSAIPLGNNVTQMIFEFDHTFAGIGAYYIFYQEFNRVGGCFKYECFWQFSFFLRNIHGYR